jgi:tight adherence protein B
VTGQALLAGLAGACLVAGVLLGAFGAFHRTGPVLPTRTAPRDLRWLRRHGITPSRAAAALVAGVVTLVVTDWPVAALGAAAGTAFVPPLLRPRSARCLIDRLDALATWTRRIADTLGAGAGGLEHAIAASARTAPSALRSELTTLAAAARIQGVEPALRSLADTLDDPAADRVVAALILRTRAGGRGLVEILDGLAASLREEALARRQV